MVAVFWAETAMHFSLKDLGLFSNSPGLDFRGCFQTVWNRIFDNIFEQSRLNLWTSFGQFEAEI